MNPVMLHLIIVYYEFSRTLGRMDSFPQIQCPAERQMDNPPPDPSALQFRLPQSCRYSKVERVMSSRPYGNGITEVLRFKIRSSTVKIFL